MSVFKPTFFELAVRTDAMWDRLSRRVRRRLGLARPLRILPYPLYQWIIRKTTGDRQTAHTEPG